MVITTTPANLCDPAFLNCVCVCVCVIVLSVSSSLVSFQSTCVFPNLQRGPLSSNRAQLRAISLLHNTHTHTHTHTHTQLTTDTQPTHNRHTPNTQQTHKRHTTYTQQTHTQHTHNRHTTDTHPTHKRHTTDTHTSEFWPHPGFRTNELLGACLVCQHNFNVMNHSKVCVFYFILPDRQRRCLALDFFRLEHTQVES